MKEGKEIINDILDHLGIKAPTFANDIGVLYSRIQKIQSGKAKGISLDLANKICAAYPEINKAYLLKGEGELLRKEGRNISVSHSPNSNIAGNDIHISGTPAQMKAVEAVLNDDSISKSDLFAVVRHLQAMNDKHLATIEKLTLANERLNAVLLELVAKWTSGNVTEDSLKSVLMKFDKWA